MVQMQAKYGSEKAKPGSDTSETSFRNRQNLNYTHRKLGSDIVQA
jgi:hypothetical protein